MTVQIKLYRFEHVNKKWWASVSPSYLRLAGPEWTYLCYDTQSFNSKKEALKEARAFAKWKKLKVKEIIEE
mgnify:CR=1 FL=1